MLISLDQVRAKSLPCFGYTQNTMPNLCSFTGKSHTFTNAFATASRTEDSHFSMITGLYPRTHTMNLPYSSLLPGDIPTLAEILQGIGMDTYFLGPSKDPHLPLDRGLGRGFTKTFEADDPDAWIKTLDVLATPSGKLAKQSFFFMHTYLAHEPYLPDDSSVSRFYSGPVRKRMTYDDICLLTYEKLVSMHPEIGGIAPGDTGAACKKIEEYQIVGAATYQDYNNIYSIIIDEYWRQFDDMPSVDKAAYLHALYAAQLYGLDAELGKFFSYLDRKNMMQNTIIIIVGDQGDEFFEHGSYSHGGTLYDEVLRVPYIVYIPKSGDSVSSRLVSLVDIVPTILDLLDKPTLSHLAGVSVFSSLTHRLVLAEHVTDGMLAVITSRYKLIRRIAGGETDLELYDLHHDPDERNNLARSNRKVIEVIYGAYKNLQSQFPIFTAVSDPLPSWVDEDDRKTLIESGYF